MKQGRIGKDLLEAITMMEKADNWPVTILLLELAQFRLKASIRSETNAVTRKESQHEKSTPPA